jgi:hypothetical protein
MNIAGYIPVKCLIKEPHQGACVVVWLQGHMLTLIIGFLVPLGVVAVLLVSILIYIAKHGGGMSALTLLRERIKRKKPPQAGNQLVLVLTDIAGSTELWEWDSQIGEQARFVS